ncbi:hypothetical protein ACWCOT_07120 [Nonomuraea bangladeshensis]
MGKPMLDNEQAFTQLFGQQVTDALVAWLGGTLRMEFAQVVMGGGSGAKIAAVYLHDRRKRQVEKLILKFAPSTDTPVSTAGAAWERAGAFSSHLVRQVDALRVDGGSLQLLEIGGDDLREWVTLSAKDLDADVVRDRFGAVVRTVLTKWDPEHAANNRKESIHRFMRMNLGTRVASGGPIYRWAAREGLLDEAASTVLLAGEPSALPNPFVLLGASGPGGYVLDQVRTGPAHGDLHAANVLIRARPSTSEEFLLIDLDRYAPDAPLSRDVCHLFLDLLSVELPKLDQTQQGGLIEELTDGRNTGDLLPNRVKELIRQFSDDYVKVVHGSGQGEEWDKQRRLSLVACSLMHVGRDRQIQSATWQWFLRLAARVTAAFLVRWNVPVPAGQQIDLTNMSMQVRGEAAPPQRRPSRKGPPFSWEELAEALLATSFDSSGRPAFRVSSRSLRQILRRQRPEIGVLPASVGNLVDSLDVVLGNAEELHNLPDALEALSQQAEELRIALLDLIPWKRYRAEAENRRLRDVVAAAKMFLQDVSRMSEDPAVLADHLEHLQQVLPYLHENLGMLQSAGYSQAVKMAQIDLKKHAGVIILQSRSPEGVYTEKWGDMWVSFVRTIEEMKSVLDYINVVIRD